MPAPPYLQKQAISSERRTEGRCALQAGVSSFLFDSAPFRPIEHELSGGVFPGANAVKEYIEWFYPNGIPDGAQEAILAASDMQCDEVTG